MRSFLVLALVAACGGQVPTDEQADDIEAGAVDLGDPAVGLLSIEGGTSCTATLVKPQVALTSAHCLLAGRAIAFVTSGGRGAIGGRVFRVAHAVDKQVAYSTAVAGECPDLGEDVGVVHLAAPVTDIVPLQIGIVGPPGEICGAVGYGQHRDSAGRLSGGVRRRATMMVWTLMRDWIAVKPAGAHPGLPDVGDEGGPLLCSGAVAGVASCPRAPGQYWFTRTDDLRGWIDGLADQWNPSACSPYGDNPCPYGYQCVDGSCAPPP